MQRNTILHGDAWELAKTLPDNSISCIITSPPYLGLRSYLPEGHTDKSAEFGCEDTPEEFVDKLVTLFHELRRALRHDGTVFLNLGDSFLDKQLLGIPWRCAFALQADGWYLRSEIIWHKRAPMPESVTDRPTKAHEQVFLLSKAPHYYYDADAVREPIAAKWEQSHYKYYREKGTTRNKEQGSVKAGYAMSSAYNPNGANKRSVWTLGPEPYPEAHFATFPTALVRPMILAGCPAEVCAACGAPVVRVVERDNPRLTDAGYKDKDATPKMKSGSGIGRNDYGTTKTGLSKPGWRELPPTTTTTTGFAPTCACDAGTVPGVVLDPFLGSGTTAVVARTLGRDWLGFELNADYIKLAEQRIGKTQPPLFVA